MSARDAPEIDVQLACEDADVPPVDEIRSWVQRTLATARGSDEQCAELSVRVVDKEEMQALNRDYRQQDKATNVLSFPAGSIDGLPSDALEPLGDIVVCAAVVREEAIEQGKEQRAHWAHMLVHGTLHLIGFDHQAAQDAAQMESLETAILSQYGIPDPYGAAR